MSYNSLEEIVRECQEKDLPFDEVILLDDMNERNVSREESIETMRGMWEAMKGAERNYDGSLQSRSGLVGGAGKTMRTYVESGNTLCGPFVGKVMASALAMGESNACMKRIVAAPTAGACGVLPAVLVNYQKEKGTADEQIVRALYTAAGIGQVVAARAYIAGASGGCQAEIGTASAMAAGALTALGGGTPSQITHAAAMALKNLLGLVCDPVGGLVEGPVRQAECDRFRECTFCGGHGTCGNHKPHSAGSGDRCDAGSRRPDASESARNRPGRPCQHAGSTRVVRGTGRRIKKTFIFGKLLV